MSSITLQGEAVRPADQPARKRVPTGTKIKASYPFTAVHHHTWTFFEDTLAPKGGEWRPDVSEIRHVPGGNGVFVRDDVINANGAVSGAMNKGSIVIRQDDRRLGDFQYYLSRYLLSDGKYFYCYNWVSIVLINRGRNAVPRCDFAKLREFQQKLVDALIVDPMPEESLNEHLLILENRMDRWAGLRSRGEMTQNAYEEQVKSAEALIERMRSAWARQFGAAEIVGEVAPSAGLPIDPASMAVEAEPQIEIEPPAEPTPKTRRRK